MVAIIVLFTTGNLNGPSLNACPDALTESIALLAIGGVIGLVIAASGRRRSS
jgi:hypothetical protein